MSFPTTGKIVADLLRDLVVYETDFEASRTERYADTWERLEALAAIMFPPWAKAPGKADAKNTDNLIAAQFHELAVANRVWTAEILDRSGSALPPGVVPPGWARVYAARKRLINLALALHAPKPRPARARSNS